MTADRNPAKGWHPSGAVRHSALSSIPLACHSLSVNEHFAGVLHQYTDLAARLQYLSIDFAKLAWGWGPSFDPLAALPNLYRLQELKTLKLMACSDYTGRDAFAVCMAKCPASLQALSIHGSCSLTIVFIPEAQQRLQTQLTQLKHLALVNCQVSLPAGSITCLEQLTKLSLEQSDIYCPDALSQLTNLISLDLTSCIWESDSIERGQALASFMSWPALRGIKFGGCSLFNSNTVFDMPIVSSVQSQYLVGGSDNSDMHLERKVDCMGDLFATILSPLWCDRMVDVRLDVCTYKCTAVYLARVVEQMFKLCSALHMLHLRCQASENYDQVSMTNGEGGARHLESFRLKGVYCKSLSLELCPSLTSVTLTGIDSPRAPCMLLLPSTLTRLAFFGSHLFATTAKHSLEGLEVLKHLTLGTRPPGFEVSAGIERLDSRACMHANTA